MLRLSIDLVGGDQNIRVGEGFTVQATLLEDGMNPINANLFRMFFRQTPTESSS